MTNLLTLSECNDRLKNGDVIAYPTEAVFGLGCDPNSEAAVLTLLKLKQRSIDKGLILIASHYQQLLPYIDDSSLNKEQKQLAFTSWPGPVTWIFPKNRTTPYFLTGKRSEERRVGKECRTRWTPETLKRKLGIPK